jgi:NhaA family Na+:H+ antiporter
VLHPFVAFFIMPVFALANSGVAVQDARNEVARGADAWRASRMQLFGVSVVAGIGFTVALFIAALAFPGADELLDQAKMGILLGSLSAGVVGFVLLRFTHSSQAAS